MKSTERQIRPRRGIIIVAVALIAMIGAGSLAVAALSGGSGGNLPAGSNVNVDSGGTVTTLKVFQWKPACTVTSAGFPTAPTFAACSAHTVKTKLTASKGDSGTLTIEHLECYASAPAVVRVTATVDTGLLVDFQDTVDIADPGPRVVTVNEWIAKLNNCSSDGSTNRNNQVLLKIDVIKDGTFNFEIDIEPA